MLQSTLCYLERGDAYLMLHRVKKEHDANRDKWIGIGGKFEDKESPEDCPDPDRLPLPGTRDLCEYGVAHGVYAPVYRYRLDRRTSRLR